MSKSPSQYNFPKPGKVLPAGSKVKPQRIRPISQGVTVPPKPPKAAMIKPPKISIAKPPKVGGVKYIRTTKAR